VEGVGENKSTACTTACTSEPKKPLSVEELAAEIVRLSPGEKSRLIALLLGSTTGKE
jgi:hypothetical protein